MRPWTRLFVSMLAVAALLAVGASCTSDDSTTGPSSEPLSQATTQPAPDPLLEPLVGQTLQAALNTVQLLTCSPQPYAQAKAVVGPAGGTVVVGTHRLTIPAGALAAPVTITAEQIRGSVNSVRFQPAGLTFAKPAILALSYSNCLLPPVSKRVVYTDERLKILEVIPSLDLRLNRTVNGSIRHFSRYAVAY